MTRACSGVATGVPEMTETTMTDDQNDVQDLATGLSRNNLRRAALTVCGHATDIEDARSLLEALGLVEDLRQESLAS